MRFGEVYRDLELGRRCSNHAMPLQELPESFRNKLWTDNQGKTCSSADHF